MMLFLNHNRILPKWKIYLINWKKLETSEISKSNIHCWQLITSVKMEHNATRFISKLSIDQNEFFMWTWQYWSYIVHGCSPDWVKFTTFDMMHSQTVQSCACHDTNHAAWHYCDGLMQERCNSTANALELRLAYTNPSSNAFSIINMGYCRLLCQSYHTLQNICED